MIYDTKVWATSFPLKTGCEYRCSRKVGSSSSTSSILYFTHIEWKITYIMEYVYIILYILIHWHILSYWYYTLHKHILSYWYYTFQFFIQDPYLQGANGFFTESGREVFASITEKKPGWILCFSFTSINVLKFVPFVLYIWYEFLRLKNKMENNTTSSEAQNPKKYRNQRFLDIYLVFTYVWHNWITYHYIRKQNNK